MQKEGPLSDVEIAVRAATVQERLDGQMVNENLQSSPPPSSLPSSKENEGK